MQRQEQEQEIQTVRVQHLLPTGGNTVKGKTSLKTNKSATYTVDPKKNIQDPGQSLGSSGSPECTLSQAKKTVLTTAGSPLLCTSSKRETNGRCHPGQSPSSRQSPRSLARQRPRKTWEGRTTGNVAQYHRTKERGTTPIKRGRSPTCR